MASRLALIGASGYGLQVLGAVRSGSTSGLELVGWLDDNESLWSSVVGGLVVLGGALDRQHSVDSLVLAVGAPSTKQSIVRRLTNTKCEWPKIVHHGAHVGADVTLERGCLVQVGATLAVGNSVGEFATVNLNASISHETKVGRFATVSPGCSIGGNVSIGEGAFIGIGASVIQGITIGAWSVVGAGAVVIEDVEPNTVVAGVPARVINRRPEGWQHG